MTRKSLLAAALLASLALVATGCQGALTGGNPGDDIGGDDDDDAPPPPPPADAGVTGGTENAQPLFEAPVAPVLQASCSAAACHGGVGNSPLKFLPADITGYYDVVVSYDDRVIGYFDKTTAPMLTRIVPGPHNGAVYTTEQAQAVRDWLDAELEARSTPGGGGADGGVGVPQTPGQVSKALIAEWSGCMDLATWDNLGVASAWANKGSGEGTCEKCHINGQSSFIATNDSARMFNILTTNKYYMLAYFTPNVTDLATAKMEVNWDLITRVGTGQYPYIEHPNFNTDINNSQSLQILQQFYDETMARKAAGQCDPPRMTP
jgi:hypothetical protein